PRSCSFAWPAAALCSKTSAYEVEVRRALAVSVHHEALARAQSPAEVCELMRGRILELMPLSGLNVMSFGSANGDAPYSALYQRGADVEEVRWRLAPALQLLLA